MDQYLLVNITIIIFITHVEFPLIYVNSTSGAVSLTGRVDYETTKSLSAVLSVNNSAIGYCDGNISNGKAE